MIFGARKLLPALKAICDSLGGVEKSLHAIATREAPGVQLDQRVAALELEMERRHAEAEGLLLKAKGKFDAARAAEERARRLADSTDSSEEDELEAIRQTYANAGLLDLDGDVSEDNGVQPMFAGMEGRVESKQNAHAMKFSRGR